MSNVKKRKNTFFLILSFLTKRQKAGVYLLIGASVIQAFLELIGISSIIPIISLVNEPSSIEQTWYLKFLYDLFHFSDSFHFLIGLIIAAILLYILRTIYVVALSVFQNRFIYRINVRLSSKAYEILLLQPYEYHLMHNSAEVIKKATYDPSSTTECLTSYISIFSSLFMALLVVVFLFLVNPLISLIVIGVLGVVSFFVIFFAKRKSRLAGSDVNEFQVKQQQEMREALGAVKEMNVYGSGSYFAHEFEVIGYQSVQDFANYYVASALPRQVIESVGMISMLLGILITEICFPNTASSIMTTFSAFAVAIVKLIPYASSLSTATTALSFRRPGIDSLQETFQLEKNEVSCSFSAKDVFSFSKEIRMENISFHYENCNNVISNANIRIPKGSCVALSGQSGAGKTTTMDMLLGLLHPQDGIISCDGRDIATSIAAWHATISYVPQYIYLSDKSIRENVAFGVDPSSIDEAKVVKALQEAQLWDFVCTLPDGDRTMIGENGARISGGQRQRIGIARALYRESPIIVFDEATSSLDYKTESEVLSSIKQLKGSKTLILVTHRISTISDFDYVYQIEKGSVILAKSK
jgi:ABC-type multidrug transport system fused ATPase/permease subunit